MTNSCLVYQGKSLKVYDAHISWSLQTDDKTVAMQWNMLTEDLGEEWIVMLDGTALKSVQNFRGHIPHYDS